VHTSILKYHLVWCIIFLGCNKQDNLPIVDVYSHAGMSIHQERTIFPPNSFEAIQHAVEVIGVEGVEIDVQMTKDSVLVLFHDQNITSSVGFEGCVHDYNWEDLKTLKLDYSNANIVTLKSTLDYLIQKNVKTYLDFKIWNACEGQFLNFSTISNQFDLILNEYSTAETDLIIAGGLTVNFLNQLNSTHKCYETGRIDSALSKAIQYGYDHVLFHESTLDGQGNALLLNHEIIWGIFGGKSNSEIRKQLQFKPNFIITDNVSFAQKNTK